MKILCEQCDAVIDISENEGICSSCTYYNSPPYRQFQIAKGGKLKKYWQIFKIMFGIFLCNAYKIVIAAAFTTAGIVWLLEKIVDIPSVIVGTISVIVNITYLVLLTKRKYGIVQKKN